MPLYKALATALLLSGCATQELPEDPDEREQWVYEDEPSFVVPAAAETTPVASADDAADDPAIWVHPTQPEQSLILGTDKQSGVAVYSLNGQLKQFLAIGEPNNIDVRQGLMFGTSAIDVAVTSNRADNTVTMLGVDADGVREIGRFAVSEEPYGICLGILHSHVMVFVTYKTGAVEMYQVQSLLPVAARQVGSLKFASQLEGCVFHEPTDQLVIGEEDHGIWITTLSFQDGEVAAANVRLLDAVAGDNGIAADVEGVAIYQDGDNSRLVVSSQGNDSYALYSLIDGNFIARFRIVAGLQADGVQETDGLEVSSRALGAAYPRGILVVQDGFNAPAGSAQNFKIVDWRLVEEM